MKCPDSSFIKKIGFKPTKEFGLALNLAKKLFENGVSESEIISEVKLLLPKHKLKMGEKPFSEAIYAETEEEEANLNVVRQKMRELMRCPVVTRGTIMPDACPAGSGEAIIPVGGVIEVDNAIIPAAHSADICCSMYATFFESDLSNKEILDCMFENSHFGAGGRAEDDLINCNIFGDIDWGNPFLKGLKGVAKKHFATCGDGNHFYSLGEIIFTEELLRNLFGFGKVYDNYLNKKVKVMVSHFGSRGFGAQVYKRGVVAAEKETNKIAENIPKACHWIPLDTKNGNDYWEALWYVAQWTEASHQALHNKVIDNINSIEILQFGNQHNHIFRDGRKFYHAKGSTPAWKGEFGIIPMNMRDGILLVSGLGNEDYLKFAPHGAGRNMSRTQLKNSFEDQAAEIEKQTENLDIRWYSGKPDLSETGIAYKSAEKIKKQIKKYKLAEILGEIKPYGCIMAGEQGEFWKK